MSEEYHDTPRDCAFRLLIGQKLIIKHRPLPVIDFEASSYEEVKKDFVAPMEIVFQTKAYTDRLKGYVENIHDIIELLVEIGYPTTDDYLTLSTYRHDIECMISCADLRLRSINKGDKEKYDATTALVKSYYNGFNAMFADGGAIDKIMENIKAS